MSERRLVTLDAAVELVRYWLPGGPEFSGIRDAMVGGLTAMSADQKAMFMRVAREIRAETAIDLRFRGEPPDDERLEAIVQKIVEGS